MPRYQINMVQGFLTHQFPTTERLSKRHVGELYDSVNSSVDFQQVLESYGRSMFFDCANPVFRRDKK